MSTRINWQICPLCKQFHPVGEPCPDIGTDASDRAVPNLCTPPTLPEQLRDLARQARNVAWKLTVKDGDDLISRLQSDQLIGWAAIMEQWAAEQGEKR